MEVTSAGGKKKVYDIDGHGRIDGLPIRDIRNSFTAAYRADEKKCVPYVLCIGRLSILFKTLPESASAHFSSTAFYGYWYCFLHFSQTVDKPKKSGVCNLCQREAEKLAAAENRIKISANTVAVFDCRDVFMALCRKNDRTGAGAQ